jgi:hypothetical protein
LWDRFGVGAVWPSDKVTPEELGTDGPVHDDAAGYLASLVARAKEQQ